MRQIYKIAGCLRLFFDSEEGQGITEYGAIIAFVAVLVAFTFGIASGSLEPALSKAFSAIVSKLNNMSATAAGAS